MGKSPRVILFASFCLASCVCFCLFALIPQLAQHETPRDLPMHRTAARLYVEAPPELKFPRSARRLKRRNRNFCKTSNRKFHKNHTCYKSLNLIFVLQISMWRWQPGRLWFLLRTCLESIELKIWTVFHLLAFMSSRSTPIEQSG